MNWGGSNCRASGHLPQARQRPDKLARDGTTARDFAIYHFAMCRSAIGVGGMVLLSFVLQVAAIGVFRQYHTRTGEDNFGFGFEMGRVGRSIALGQGFSNPYGDTGPSAWQLPLYPYLIGGVFKIFGVYTHASAWVLLTINSLLAALTTIPVYLVAQRTFGARVAIWSARAWALNPYVWYWSIHWIWDTTFTPLMLALIFLVTLELERWPGWQGWMLFGILWGVEALANSHDACLSAVLRAVGVAAEIPAERPISGRCVAFVVRVLCGSFAMAGAEL